MKKILLVILLTIPFLSKSQCSFSFNDLVRALKSNETTLNNELSNKGYIYNSKESIYVCGGYDGYLFKLYFEDGGIGIDYLMPNSSYEIQKIINDAKIYGMKLTDSNTNPETGLPNNIYEGGKGNLMMQISSNEKFHSITIYGLR